MSAFTYNGVWVGGPDYGVSLLDISKLPSAPEVRMATANVDAANGSVDRVTGYEARDLACECVVEATDRADLVRKLDRLKTLLNPRLGTRFLTFDHEVGLADDIDRGYFAFLNGPIETPQFGHVAQFQLNFRVPKGVAFGVVEKVEVVNVNANPLEFLFPQAPGEVVLGTELAHPVYLFTCTQTNTGFYLRNQDIEFELFAWDGGLYENEQLRFDAATEEVHKSTDGGITWTRVPESLSSVMFPRLLPGVKNNLKAGGCLGTLSITYRGEFV